MIINGKERHFAYTIEAAEEIGKLCAEGDIKNLESLYTGTGQQGMKNDMKLAIILNKAYEDRKAYFDPHYHPDYLTEADFRHFLVTDIGKLELEFAKVMTADSAVTVETAPVEETGKKTD